MDEKSVHVVMCIGFTFDRLLKASALPSPNYEKLEYINPQVFSPLAHQDDPSPRIFERTPSSRVITTTSAGLGQVLRFDEEPGRLSKRYFKILG